VQLHVWKESFPMTRHLSPAITLTASAAIVGLALSACGSSSLSSPGTSGAPTAAQTKDAALVATLPAKIKTAGKIIVGVDTSYPPSEFLAAERQDGRGL